MFLPVRARFMAVPDSKVRIPKDRRFVDLSELILH